MTEIRRVSSRLLEATKQYPAALVCPVFSPSTVSSVMSRALRLPCLMPLNSNFFGFHWVAAAPEMMARAKIAKSRAEASCPIAGIPWRCEMRVGHAGTFRLAIHHLSKGFFTACQVFVAREPLPD